MVFSSCPRRFISSNGVGPSWGRRGEKKNPHVGHKEKREVRRRWWFGGWEEGLKKKWARGEKNFGGNVKGGGPVGVNFPAPNDFLRGFRSWVAGNLSCPGPIFRGGVARGVRGGRRSAESGFIFTGCGAVKELRE